MVQRFLPKRQLTPEDAVHDREESGTASTIPAARLQCPGPGPCLPSKATVGRQTVSRQGIVSVPPVPRSPGPGPRLPSEATAGRQTVSRQGIVSAPACAFCWNGLRIPATWWWARMRIGAGFRIRSGRAAGNSLSSGRALHTAWAVRGNRGAVLGLGPQPKQPGTRLPLAFYRVSRYKQNFFSGTTARQKERPDPTSAHHL